MILFFPVYFLVCILWYVIRLLTPLSLVVCLLSLLIRVGLISCLLHLFLFLYYCLPYCLFHLSYVRFNFMVTMSAGSSDQQQKPSHTQFKTVFIIYSCFAAVRVGNTAVFFHCLSLNAIVCFLSQLHNNDALVQLLATQTHKQQASLLIY